jgi:hypothetical protein
MSKLRVLVVLVALALVVPLAVSGQKVKPPKPPAYTPCTVELEVNSDGSIVQVGRDVGTYGPVDQALYIHESLLPLEGAADPTGGIALVKRAPLIDGFYGPYYGQIRVLNDRIDYWFDTAPGCGEAVTSAFPCRFRAIVVDGVPVYEKVGKTRMLTHIAFEEGRYLLDYRWCDPATDPACYVKLLGCYDDRDCPGVLPGGEGYVYATVNVLFQQ